MIPVRGIVIGGQDGPENRAGFVADFLQEQGFGVVSFPIVKKADPGTIGKGETRNVDGISGGVLAPCPVSLPVHAAAAKGAEVSDGSDFLPQNFPRGRLDTLIDP